MPIGIFSPLVFSQRNEYIFSCKGFVILFISFFLLFVLSLQNLQFNFAFDFILFGLIDLKDRRWFNDMIFFLGFLERLSSSDLILYVIEMKILSFSIYISLIIGNIKKVSVYKVWSWKFLDTPWGRKTKYLATVWFLSKTYTSNHLHSKFFNKYFSF